MTENSKKLHRGIFEKAL